MTVSLGQEQTTVRTYQTKPSVDQFVHGDTNARIEFLHDGYEVQPRVFVRIFVSSHLVIAQSSQKPLENHVNVLQGREVPVLIRYVREI